MKLRVQVVIEFDDEDDEHAPAAHEVAQIDRMRCRWTRSACTWAKRSTSYRMCKRS